MRECRRCVDFLHIACVIADKNRRKPETGRRGNDVNNCVIYEAPIDAPTTRRTFDSYWLDVRGFHKLRTTDRRGPVGEGWVGGGSGRDWSDCFAYGQRRLAGCQ